MTSYNNDDVIRYYPTSSADYKIETMEKFIAELKRTIAVHNSWQQREVELLSSTNGTGWKRGKIEINITFVPSDEHGATYH